MHKSWPLGHQAHCNLNGNTYHLWILNTELVSCHSSGAKNFEVVPRFLEYMCTPILESRHTTAAEVTNTTIEVKRLDLFTTLLTASVG